ncbi:MAG: hypothetical protein PHE53_01995 [Thermoguttaceae bacterium]|nr:hypothetical protein [Thermoguttaceae bacterium]
MEQTSQILTKITCPHCWEIFSTDQTLYVSQHPELLGDPRLGPNAPLRFLPSRFRVDGAALDPNGFPSLQLACPCCHLAIPRSLFEMPSIFFSMIGAPGSGKSYFLAAMTWRLRQLLPQLFHLHLTDADPQVNLRLQEYESQQFLNPDPNCVVQLAKTETYGDLYDAVVREDQTIYYLRPFLFSLVPDRQHPLGEEAWRVARTLYLYDNAGESFLPGEDRATTPVTRHLALSKVIFVLFDPTQDVRFHRAMQALSGPSLEREKPAQVAGMVRQETLFIEAISRLRRYAGLGQHQKLPAKIIVVVTKQDVWGPLCPDLQRVPSEFWRYISSDLITKGSGASAGGNTAARGEDAVEKTAILRSSLVHTLSGKVEELLRKISPEFVSAIDGISGDAVYIPVSATGGNAVTDAQGRKGFRPKDIHPKWTEVPMLYAIATQLEGVIPHTLNLPH